MPSRNGTVLIVEDDRATREMYRRALALLGYQVIAVADGYDALNAVDAKRPDVVILDLLLPRVAGLDVYRELRSRVDTSSIPIIIVTGSDARDLGPASFPFLIRKPIGPDTLAAMVAHALQPASPAA